MAKQNMLENFTNDLLNVRGACEMKSLASLNKADAYDSEVRQMETEEKYLLETLGNTTR